MDFPPKPLGHVKQGLAELGHELSYVYDDLIFPDHNAYLMQFGEKSYKLNIYLNKECHPESEEALKEDLIRVMAGSIGFTLEFPGRYTLMPREDSEEMEIRFLP